MNNAFNPVAFGQALHELRKKKKRMTLKQLSAELAKVAGLGLSTTKLHYFEVGAVKRAPARDLVRGMGRALAAAPSETQDLLRLAGYGAASQTLADRAGEAVAAVLQIAETEDGELFVRQVEAAADRFARSLSARGDEVRIALIPVAGWQARVLAPEVVERMLIPALQEVSHAGIREVTLIVAPGAAAGWTLRQRFPHLTIRTIEQTQTSGLGRALLLARPTNHFGPVGVVLPDEVDSTGEALGELVRQYRGTNRCLVAVNPSPAEKEKREILRYYGIAVLKQRSISGQSSRAHELHEPLMEKRDEPQGFPRNSRKIAGRYVLTPEIFDSIELTGPELTTALNEHWRRLYAFELRHDLIALSPYQEILQVISSIKSPA